MGATAKGAGLTPPPSRAAVVAVGLSAAMAVFITTVVVLADTRHLGPLAVIYEYRHGDKLGHFMLFGGLAFLLAMAALLLRPRSGTGLALRVTAVFAAVITLEEFSQIFLPSRSPDPFDLLAGYAGVALGAGLALLLTRLSGVQRADQAGV